MEITKDVLGAKNIIDLERVCCLVLIPAFDNSFWTLLIGTYFLILRLITTFGIVLYLKNKNVFVGEIFNCLKKGLKCFVLTLNKTDLKERITGKIGGLR